MAVNIYDPPSGWTSQVPEEHGRPPFSTVAGGIAEIDAAGPAELPSERLRADLYWMAGQQRALEAMQARWLAELDKRDTDPLDGSAELWLQHNLRQTSNAAYAQVRTARQLEEPARGRRRLARRPHRLPARVRDLQGDGPDREDLPAGQEHRA